MSSPKNLFLSFKALLWVSILAAATFLSAHDAAFAANAVQPGYVIHGNDQLSISVYGDQTLSQTVTVLPNGDIAYPLVGRIHIGGQTPEQAARTVEAALKKYVRHPIVSVSVTQQGQLNVLVLGNVKNPSKFALAPTSHLTDAIAAAGGLGPTNGSLPNARVADKNGNVTQVSLQKLFHDGDVTADAKLSEGSVVYIPSPLTFNVEVVGAVDKPGEIQLNEGDRLTMAIAKAGTTPNTQADLNHVHVTRTRPDGTSFGFYIDLYHELQGGDISKDVVLQKGDVVYVPQSRKPLGGNSAYYILLGLRRLIGIPF